MSSIPLHNVKFFFLTMYFYRKIFITQTVDPNVHNARKVTKIRKIISTGNSRIPCQFHTRFRTISIEM